MRLHNDDGDIAQACRNCMVKSIPFAPGSTHPDTSPDVIVQAQRDVVRESVLLHGIGTELKTISDDVILPVSIVECRCHELGVRTWHGRIRALGNLTSPIAPAVISPEFLWVGSAI